MLYFDPIYLIFLLPGLLLSLWASWRVKANFSYYSQIPNASGMTGAEAAQYILDQAGIHDVEVTVTEGFLSDHYDPLHKRLALSPETYYSRSIAAVGVAAHEAGHALQHATQYAPLWLRSTLVPTAHIGSTLGYIVMAIGLFIHPFVVLLGVVLFSAVLLFQLVTLPVEFDASRRAKQLLLETGIIAPQEREGVDRVLNAAAWTYVAAVVSTLLTILYFLFRAGLLSGSSRDE
ncbi:MAG: zinc metallopeptidase [Gemmatales bacterium]|nr:zinc metallopeptidase [Gemmatales bacterium]MDW7995084.1 zinc metallopeptidase [Gemmatales bacterium]